MNATTSAEQTALTVPERATVALGASEYELKLRELLSNSCRIVAPANKAARDECHAAYMVLKNARCSIVNLTEDATEDAKAFTKAVKTESERLIAITSAEEDRLKALRDAWDDKIEAEKQAKIAAERERVDAIINLIDDIKSIPAKHAMSDSAAIRSALDHCKAWVIDAPVFQEFRDKAAAALGDAIHALEIMLATVEKREQDAIAAEEARNAEAELLAAEKAELARQQAAAAIVAAEQAAEAKRLADAAKAQAAAAEALRLKAEANLQAEREANAEQLRIERERVAKEQEAANAELKAAQARLNAEQAAFLAKQEQAERAAEAAHAKSSDFDEILSTRVDLIREMIGADDTVQIVTYPLSAVLDAPAPSIEDLADEAGDDAPTDEDIIDVVCVKLDMSWEQAIDRVSAIDFAGLRAAIEKATGRAA